MTRTKFIAMLRVLLASLPAIGDTGNQTPLPGEALYLVVLGERPSEPDIAALGGRILRSWSDRRLVAIPPDRAGELKTLKSVTYVQRIWTGEPFASIPADSKRTFQSQGTTLDQRDRPRCVQDRGQISEEPKLRISTGESTLGVFCEIARQPVCENGWSRATDTVALRICGDGRESPSQLRSSPSLPPTHILDHHKRRPIKRMPPARVLAQVQHCLS